MTFAYEKLVLFGLQTNSKLLGRSDVYIFPTNQIKCLLNYRQLQERKVHIMQFLGTFA
jgi:hypothetical protein